MKGFIEVQCIMLNKLLININDIQILWCDSKIKLKGVEKEIEIEASYEEIKELIKQAQ